MRSNGGRPHERAHVALQSERDRISTEQLERFQRLRHEFLSNLSHELRTPLHVINLSAQLIRTAGSQERVARSLEVIERNVDRESRVVDELLDMAALVTGRIRLSWARVDLQTVVREVVAAVRPTAAAKGVHLHEDSLSPGAEVRGDPARLHQCLWQLLLNAVKFTAAQGHVWISVEVQERRGARDVQISVRDTGRGISQEFVPFAFDPFTQQDGGTTRTYDGLGLGLALVRHIIELHGGRIEAHSEGEGATFRIRLPQNR